MDTPQGTFYRVYFDIYLTLDGTEFNAELVCQGEVMGRCSARFRWFDFPSLWQRFLVLTHFFIVQNTLSRWKRPKSYTTHNQRNAKWDKKDNGQIGGGVRRVWKGRQSRCRKGWQGAKQERMWFLWMWAIFSTLPLLSKNCGRFFWFSFSFALSVSFPWSVWLHLYYFFLWSSRLSSCEVMDRWNMLFFLRYLYYVRTFYTLNLFFWFDLIILTLVHQMVASNEKQGKMSTDSK